MGRTQRLRRRRTRPPFDVSESVMELMAWFRRNGVRRLNPPLTLTIFPDTGRGLMTRRRLAKTATLIEIPLKLLICRQKCEKNLRDVLRADSVLPTQHLLALFLLRESEKGSTAFWSPYLRSLPLTYDVPFYCSQSEIESLPTYIQEACLQQKNIVSRAYQLVTANVRSPEVKFLSFDRFCWAWFSVNTRAVYLDQVNAVGASMSENNFALAPFLDMFNHSSQVSVRVGVFASADFDDGVYRIASNGQSYRKHDQVFINYGAHDNLRLCVEYGFVIESNDCDQVPFSLQELAVASCTGSDTRRIMEKVKSHRLHKNLGVFRGKEFVSWNFLACLHILKGSTIDEVFASDFQDLLSAPAIKDCLTTIIKSKLNYLEMCLNQIKPELKTRSFEVIENLMKIHKNILSESLRHMT